MSGQESALQMSSTSSEDGGWSAWANANGVVAPKLTVRAPAPEERGKGGVFAAESIAPMEVIARIPRKLVICPTEESAAPAAKAKECSWATELTAAALVGSSALSTTEGVGDDGITWPLGGGWATEAADLGGEDGRWGATDVVGTLVATGSDNDKNIYAKFRFPCHPVVHRAGQGLAALTRTKEADAREALVRRGFAFRAMRDALIPLVASPTPRWSKGSVRDRKSWDVADTFSRVLARATLVDLDEGASAPTPAILPLHERLAHCDSRGENAKVVGRNPNGDDDDVLLVATRAIESGEAITRDYESAPALPGDETKGALRLLLQYGLPYSAWPDF